MTKLKIKVTKEVLKKSFLCGYGEIEQGSTDYNQNCAIALAVRDIFPKAEVTKTLIFPLGRHFNEYALNIDLPEEAVDFVQEFDEAYHTPSDRLELPELEFEIDIPDELVERINIDELKPLLINHPTLELVG